MQRRNPRISRICHQQNNQGIQCVVKMAKREALTLKEADSSSSFPRSLWTNRRCCLYAYRNLARYSQICGESRHIQPLVYTALQGCDIAHMVSAALSYSHDQSASDSRDFETRNNVRGYCLLAPRLRNVFHFPDSSL